MPRSGRRARRRAAALSRTRPLLERILDTPHLAHVVPRLQPDVLHRVIQTCGLEDCAELVALATPAQLAGVFDFDLWRSTRPGLDERLDAERFGVWLEVLLECGADVAVQKLAGIDIELVVAALAAHVRVFDPAAIMATPSDDHDAIDRKGTSDTAAEVGGYLIEAKRTDAWDAIVTLLLALDAGHSDYFHRLMRGCRRLSNSTPEADGFHNLLTDDEQGLFDLSVDRETRRERQGFLSSAQARAFLQMARLLDLERGTAPVDNAVARAYFQAIQRTAPEHPDTDEEPQPLLAESPGSSLTPQEEAEAIAAVADLLVEAGVITEQPRALLAAPEGNPSRVPRIETLMQFARDNDADIYSTRTAEFGYLANALVSGCSLQGRAFTPREASDAVLAVCNLGLENWPDRWLAPEGRVAEDFLIDYDLVRVFQVGWTMLHHDVCIYTAEHLVEILTGLRCTDRETQEGLDDLRIEMTRQWKAGTPWRAREALEVIMSLDMAAWASLLGLIQECPVMHAAMCGTGGSRARTVHPSAFEFISANGQVAAVRDFLRSLPEILRG